jgi:hypothetical protein
MAIFFHTCMHRNIAKTHVLGLLTLHGTETCKHCFVRTTETCDQHTLHNHLITGDEVSDKNHRCDDQNKKHFTFQVTPPMHNKIMSTPQRKGNGEEVYSSCNENNVQRMLSAITELHFCQNFPE